MYVLEEEEKNEKWDMHEYQRSIKESKELLTEEKKKEKLGHRWILKQHMPTTV